jgi:hypothetical protein
MATPLEQLKARIAAQRTDNPAMYGSMDFDIWPERLLDGEAEQSEYRGKTAGDVERLLANHTLIERLQAYTMLGDTVADPYAALMPSRGFRPLVDMLVAACDHGIDSVTDAPDELRTFIAAMEATPAWVDMKLVERGAAIQRNAMANFAPWAIRGAFVATFMNKYAALPMALTGTLSQVTAAKRIKETATFFATSALPHALDRHGPGFKAAAMVRLMHSMVRFNLLSRARWDQAVYGMPIPQVDQMPAGLIGDFFLSMKALEQGRTSFDEDERAQVELSRYRCFLLGLPEDLLADDPQGIVDNWNARALTLRRGFNDATCGELLRATMAAELGDTSTAAGVMRERFEKSFAKVYFMQNFCGNSTAKARSYGIHISPIDVARATAVGVKVMGDMRGHELAARLPLVGRLAQARVTSKLERYLDTLGHAQFTSDGEEYRPAATKVP